MVRIASQALSRCTATRFSCGCRQGLLPRFPDGGIRLNAHHILQSELRKIRAKLRSLSITRICQHYPSGNLLLPRLPNLLQSNLRLGLKLDLLRHARLSTAFRLLAPFFGQIESPPHRQTRTPRAHRQTHRHLQLSDLPHSPQYCRATPTECFPCLGKPVSSTIHATTGPCFSMLGSTYRRTSASISSSFQGASATK